MAEVGAEGDLFGRVFGVPLKFVDVRAKIHKLKTNFLAFVRAKVVDHFEIFKFEVSSVSDRCSRIFKGRSSVEVFALGRFPL